MFEGLVYMTYRGPRLGDFVVAGRVTRIKYKVDGRNGVISIDKSGQRGVHPADVRWFCSARDYVIAEPDKAIDIQDLTVAEIKELDITQDDALALYGQEELGKDRKSVLEYLDGGSWK